MSFVIVGGAYSLLPNMHLLVEARRQRNFCSLRQTTRVLELEERLTQKLQSLCDTERRSKSCERSTCNTSKNNMHWLHVFVKNSLLRT